MKSLSSPPSFFIFLCLSFHQRCIFSCNVSTTASKSAWAETPSLTALALSLSTSGGQAGVSTDSHGDEFAHKRASGSKVYAVEIDSAKRNAMSGSRYESIDELGDAYFDVSDWTTSQDGHPKTSQLPSQDELTQIRLQGYNMASRRASGGGPLVSAHLILSSGERTQLIGKKVG